MEFESQGSRQKDLVLRSNEFAYISDNTKGVISCYTGPYKSSLSATDTPVIFDGKQFKEANLDSAKQLFPVAPEGWYIQLKNPAGENKNPGRGNANNVPELQIGHKVNIPGPISFALWPGQTVRVLKGHHLRSNQYLVVRVYDEVAARANWKNAVMKAKEGADVTIEAKAEDLAKLLNMGTLLIIKGTDVSFYIPPTGVEVVRDKETTKDDVFVRDAVTLETLEYCILLDEDGNKRYIQGPDVVFPEPTETFVTSEGNRKYKAIELNENSGIYVRVIEDYVDGEGETAVTHKKGEELFITGKETAIYYPRPEHAIIKYGDKVVNYGIAIPAGEGRYVLDRVTGKVELRKGPMMFLPDPRREVIVRRVLSENHVDLWFPNSKEAKEVNKKLSLSTLSGNSYVESNATENASYSLLGSVSNRTLEKTMDFYAGDELKRGTTFTPPRSITLDTKYDGVVTINVWTGYAIQVINKTGNRDVVVGPAVRLLNYDEILEAVTLSTGKPKNTDHLLKTAYLKVKNNKVSDIVEVETKDFCKVKLKVSYCLNFEGDPKSWFNVENYVKYLCDFMRSLLKNRVKHYNIDEFYANASDIVRDIVLDKKADAAKKSDGRHFDENGMHLYDAEILEIELLDEQIRKLLVEAEHKSVSQMLRLKALNKDLEITKAEEQTKQEVENVLNATRLNAQKIRQELIAETLVTELAEIAKEAEKVNTRLDQALEEQKKENEVHLLVLDKDKATEKLRKEKAANLQAAELEKIKAESESLKERAAAISPDLIAALENVGDKETLERVVKAMAPLSILGGESVADVVQKMLAGTTLGDVAQQFLANKLMR